MHTWFISRKYIRKVDCITSSWFLLSMYGSILKKEPLQKKTTTCSNASGDADVVQTLWACSGTVAFGGSRTSRGDDNGGSQRGSMFDDWPWFLSNEKINMIHDLGGGFKYLSCSPLLGEMIQSDYFFGMGWNHQLVMTWDPEKKPSVATGAHPKLYIIYCLYIYTHINNDSTSFWPGIRDEVFSMKNATFLTLSYQSHTSPFPWRSQSRWYF